MGQIAEAWADYIQLYAWDFYSTVTFRRLRRDPLVAAAAVWSILDGKFLATRAFVAVERHVLDGVHLHLLSEHYHEVGRQGVKAHSMWLYLFKAFGRASVEEIRSSGQVSSYCSKYVSKGEQYNLFGEPQAWVPQTPAVVNDVAQAESVIPASAPTLWQPALPGLDVCGIMPENQGGYDDNGS